MSERTLLAACISDRKAYDSVSKYLRPGDFTEESRIVLETVGQYYDRDPKASGCDAELLTRQVQNAVKNPKHRETLGSLVESLCRIEVSAPNIVEDILAQQREAAGQRLAALLVGGEKKRGELDKALESYLSIRESEELSDEGTEILEDVPVSELVEGIASPDALIKLYPKVLNDRVDGGMLRGHHVVIYGRPEMGKTSFTINLVYGFLRQNLRVLYVGNEEPCRDLAVRIVGRLCQWTKYDVIADTEGAYRLARERGYKNLRIAALSPGTPREIEAQIIDFKPDVVILDQLRNIDMKEEHYVVKLEKAATAARNLGKRHNCLVVSITQAGDSAEGKAILNMGDVDSSNTGIPATADLMVGIGATEEDKELNRRVLSLPKNKRGGDHAAFPVRVDLTMARVTSG